MVSQSTLAFACVAVALLVPAPAVHAGQANPLRVLVVLQNVAGIPQDQVDRVQTEAARLFRQIDIAIEWIAETPKEHAGVRMLALTKWEPIDQSVPAAVMGFTQTVPGGRGRRAYVFLPRVLRTARKFKVEVERLMAVAIAHELGHTLLPDASHAAKGIMRAPWDYFDLRLASHGRLRFSEESAVLMRCGLDAEASEAPRCVRP